MERRLAYSMIVCIIGIFIFLLGTYLVKDLILKFLKFTIGLFLIFISIPMIFGSIGWLGFFRRGKVVKIYGNNK